MGAFGALFPGRKIRNEAGESGNGQGHDSFGPIDLENGTMTLRRPGRPPAAPEPTDADTDPTDPGRSSDLGL